MKIKVQVKNLLLIVVIMLAIHYTFFLLFGEVLSFFKAMFLQLIIMYILPPFKSVIGDDNGPK